MQNQINAVEMNVAATATNAVVLHDTTNVAAPALTAGEIFAANYKRIEQLIVEREVWENGVVRTCNEQLYALLARCYTLYIEMCGGSTQAAALRGALDDVIAKKGYSNSFNKKTHTLTKIVKCVFGVDRRRVSAYSLVLREALAQKKTAGEIAGFIAEAGGVEEVRRAKSATAITPKQRAELGKQAVGGAQLAVISNAKLSEQVDPAKVGNDLVAIVTQQADGSFVVRALIHSQSVLDAAFASAYSENKGVVQSNTKNADAANSDQFRADLINAAAAI